MDGNKIMNPKWYSTSRMVLQGNTLLDTMSRKAARAVTSSLVLVNPSETPYYLLTRINLLRVPELES